MKLVIWILFLVFTNCFAYGQCDKCTPTQGSFGKPHFYVLEFDPNGTLLPIRQEKYKTISNFKIIERNSQDFIEFSEIVKTAIEKYYSKRFADSCNIETVQMNIAEEVDYQSPYFRVIMTLSLSKTIKYRFGMDFTETKQIIDHGFPKLPDDKLFNPAIDCAKAISISKFDKQNPISKPCKVNLLHLPYPPELERIDEETLVWVVSSEESYKDPKGYIKISEKYIDYFTGHILLRKQIKRKEDDSPIQVDNKVSSPL